MSLGCIRCLRCDQWSFCGKVACANGFLSYERGLFIVVLSYCCILALLFGTFAKTEAALMKEHEFFVAVYLCLCECGDKHHDVFAFNLS